MSEQTNRGLAFDPQDLERLLVSRENVADVDGMTALYEPQALLDDGGGRLVHGREAIRKFYAELVATGRKFERGEQRAAMVCGDLALTSTRLPDGTVTAEIARRQSDGTWLWVIDQFSISSEIASLARDDGPTAQHMISHSSMNGHVRFILWGAALSALTIAAALPLPKAVSLPVLAVLLGFIAGVYLGFALLDGRARYLVIECGFIAVVVSLAGLGLLVSPFFLAAGYILHGVWDALHHEARGVATRIARFWPPFCAVYDLLVGVFVCLWFRS